ncbi:chemotaxis protein CheW [Ruminobacter sp.]|jgi:two-component system chemotaxis sensor kinase CheA|uniref:chemotaxis protein CheW n=1 Tax=Ruminobacter sp. TaxID=2774296 RepID=UPI0038656A00
MALDGVDQEILEDFLVEAGEIIDNLATQLVDLEKTPEDKDLLNSIFRGFHTVKGGAGFLNLTDLVNVCHGAESVFDALRKDTCKISPELMDVVLQAYDCICGMFTQLKEGNMPTPPDSGLIDRLHAIASGEAVPTSPKPVIEESKPSVEPKPASGDSDGKSPNINHDFSDDDFENLLNSLNADSDGNGDSPNVHKETPVSDDTVKSADDLPKAPGAGGQEFSDDDFEALLDSLHGGDSSQNEKSEEDSGTGDEAASVSQNEEESLRDPVDDDFESMLSAAEATPVYIPELKNLDEEDTSVSAAEKTASAKAGAGTKKTEPAKPAAVMPDTSKQAAGSGTDFSDDDFEKLLDSLYGQGGSPTGSGSEKSSTPSEPKQEIKAAPKPLGINNYKTPSSSGTADNAGGVSASATVTHGSAGNSVSQTPAATSDKHHVSSGSGAVADTTVRVDVKIMDDIMNMVGELVLVRNRLLSLSGAHENLVDHYEEVQKAIANLNLITGDIQGLVMKTRMQPIKRVFSRFPRVVRDLARNLNKEIELVTEGEDTDLDKNLVDSLADLMIHLVRNSCDHGIEPPDVREKAGKNRVGKITLSASQQGDHVLLKVMDDGYGMDPEVIKNTAIKQGILDRERAKTMTDEESYNLIFAPGFSTKTAVSDISGRGVGMDVVKTNIAKLNGSFTIYSRKGSGTTIEIKVPLTLAILPTMMVLVGNQNFALPLSSINEIFYLKLDDINNLDGQKTIVIREKAYPLFYLQDWLVRDKNRITHPSEAPVIMVHSFGGADNMVAFVVDDLIGQEEVVIKPLDVLLRGVPGIAGSAITSQGGISLIVDIPGLLRSYAGKYVNNMYRAKLA